MTDRTPCLRCNRIIDASAKTCPFCSWDQSETPPPPSPANAAPVQTYYTPPHASLWRNRIFGSIAFVVLLVGAFVVGSLVHTPDLTEAKATAASTHSAPARKSSIDLVPAGNDNTPGNESPITSAPVTAGGGTTANPYARDDATALPQINYAQLAQRAKAEQPPKGPQLVDPRTVGGGAYPAPQSHGARADVPMASAMSGETPGATPSRHLTRTEPVAVYQPVPSMNVNHDATARLLLTVGADGRVKDVDITQAPPSDTARLIGAVQEWRFRPATENGIPVAARFSVDITFHAND